MSIVGLVRMSGGLGENEYCGVGENEWWAR